MVMLGIMREFLFGFFTEGMASFRFSCLRLEALVFKTEGGLDH